MTCVGGGILPDWLPAWLVEQSQGLAVCGIEFLMLLEGVLVLVVLLTSLSRMARR